MSEMRSVGRFGKRCSRARARTESRAARTASNGSERVTWRKDRRADQDGDRSGCYSGGLLPWCVDWWSLTDLDSRPGQKGGAPLPKSADGAFIGQKDRALLLACSLFPTSTSSSSCPSPPHQSSQCPASSFVTVVLADWTGCTDHNAERALASGSGAEGRTTDQAYMSGEG